MREKLKQQLMTRRKAIMAEMDKIEAERKEKLLARRRELYRLKNEKIRQTPQR